MHKVPCNMTLKDSARIMLLKAIRWEPPGELVDGAHSDALNCIDLELLSFASEDVDISAQVLG